MNKTFKFQLRPSAAQEQQLLEFAAARRFTWNWWLDTNQQAYEYGGIFVWKMQMWQKMPEFKEQYPWLKSVPAHVLIEAAGDLDKALPRNSHKTKKGFPHFSCKGQQESFRISQVNSHIKIADNAIQIPKIGWVGCKIHQEVIGKIKTLNVKQKNGRWWVAICVELPDVELQPARSDNIVGIDLGMQTFAALSDGTEIHKPNHLNQKEVKLRRYQRQMSRKQLGSNNRKKARVRLARAHEKFANTRQDFLHKASRKIINKYDGVCMESLKIKEMQMCNKTLGRRASNRKISDLGWGMFIQFVAYKAQWAGKQFVQIDQWAPSSQVCSCCDHRMGPMAPDIREWTCPACGTTHDRDFNAALNIKRWGLALMCQDLIDVPREPGEFTPVEIMSSTLSISGSATQVCEAGSHVL